MILNNIPTDIMITIHKNTFSEIGQINYLLASEKLIILASLSIKI